MKDAGRAQVRAQRRCFQFCYWHYTPQLKAENPHTGLSDFSF